MTVEGEYVRLVNLIHVKRGLQPMPGDAIQIPDHPEPYIDHMRDELGVAS